MDLLRTYIAAALVVVEGGRVIADLADADLASGLVLQVEVVGTRVRCEREHHDCGDEAGAGEGGERERRHVWEVSRTRMVRLFARL